MKKKPQSLLSARTRMEQRLHAARCLPEAEPDLICYHLTDDGTWCITPCRDVREECWFSLAADGSCYCCRNEWDVVFAAEISCG